MPRIYTTKNIVDDNGRECTKCGVYKPRKQYHNCTKGTNYKKCHCIECETKYKEDNRQKARDRENKRYANSKLAIGSEVIIEKGGNIDKYVVLEYKPQKGYLLKSHITGYYKRQSLWRNGQKGYMKVHKI